MRNIATGIATCLAHFDKNGDGKFTVDERRVMAKPMLDAVDSSNYEMLDRWARTPAGVRQ